MVDKGDIGSSIGIAAGMVGAALSWIVGLGVITILISIGIGSMLTYVVQTKTQNNAWKREAALRKVDDIYGPIYSELNIISQALSNDGSKFPLKYFNGIPNAVTWGTIRTGYKSYLVDSVLREELDAFFEKLDKYQKNRWEVPRIVERHLLPHLREAFGNDVQAASYQLTALSLNGVHAGLPGNTLDAPISSGEHPLIYTEKLYPDFTDYQLELSIQRGGSSTLLFGRSNPNPDASKKFDDLITLTIKEVEADPIVTSIREETPLLLATSESLRSKLRLKIEEPWNV